MDSLVGYGSDDENETERPTGHHYSAHGSGGGSSRRRDDDTNYDDVNMDMSEDSQAESEPELPPAYPAHPAHPAPSNHHREDRRGSGDSRDRDRDSDRSHERSRERERSHERRDKRRDSPPRHRSDRREPRRDDKYRYGKDKDRADRGRGYEGSSKRGLLGDRPDDKVPALMDLKPFGGEPPPNFNRDKASHDARDAVSPRFIDRERSDRRDKDRGDRERERDRERHSRRSQDRWSGSRSGEYRSRSRGAAFPPPGPVSTSSTSNTTTERRGSPPSGDYRPSSYKVNKKLEVMEKMGLQIKTPDGSMATAQQLRAAAGEAPPHTSGGLPAYYNPSAINSNKILDQVQKRKLLWSNKGKSEAEEAAKWSGTRFAADNDGKQVSKFMRLMGIKEPAAVKPESTDKTADPIKKQEELFSAMQAQYEVARATTHTMRGVGLGFQRGQL